MATITRFDPVGPASLHDEVERMFRQAFGRPFGVARGDDSSLASPAGAFGPALDVEESTEAFTLHIELPGVRAEDVDVSLEENVLTVAGERPFYAEREDTEFRRIERNFGRFHRAVRLPDRVDADRVRAVHRDGVLTITVPKAEDAKPRRIAVITD
jgi:HSP20 family protein